MDLMATITNPSRFWQIGDATPWQKETIGEAETEEGTREVLELELYSTYSFCVLQQLHVLVDQM